MERDEDLTLRASNDNDYQLYSCLCMSPQYS
jgi:hypothetical protein